MIQGCKGAARISLQKKTIFIFILEEEEKDVTT